MNDILDEKQTLARADEIIGYARSVLDTVLPSALEKRYEALERDATSEMSVKGVLPRNHRQMLADILMKDSAEVDKNLQTLSMTGVLKPLQEFEPALERTTKHHQTLRPELKYSGSDRLLARVVNATERTEARARLAGRTFQNLAEQYEAANDEDHGAFAALVEHEHQVGFSSLSLKSDGSVKDTEALMRLTRAINERQAARTPLFIKEVRARLSAMVDDMTRDRITKIGRGNATPATDYVKNRLNQEARRRAERLATA